MTRDDEKAILDAIDFLDCQIDIVNDLFEAKLKQAYIDGSNSNNELIK